MPMSRMSRSECRRRVARGMAGLATLAAGLLAMLHLAAAHGAAAVAPRQAGLRPATAWRAKRAMHRCPFATVAAGPPAARWSDWSPLPEGAGGAVDHAGAPSRRGLGGAVR